MYEECSDLLKSLLQAQAPGGAPLLGGALRDRAHLCLALIDDAREEASAQEKYASLGRLAAAVLHELLNPLAYLQTNLEVLSANLPALLAGEAIRDENLADETKGLVEDSRGGVERISAALSALRILLREDVTGMRGDVRRAASAAARLLSMRLPPRVRLEMDLVEVPAVACGDGLVGQVLLHLLLRSLDTLDGAGVLYLRVRSPQPTEVAVEIAAGLPGDGIDRPELIEARAAAQADHNQLGFSLARSLVERAGGQLERLPEPGPGARYLVRLPAAALPPEP